MVAALPRALIAFALAASPLVAVTTAAQIDIVRSDLLYQISPLAHVQIDYPSWPGAAAGYLAIACVCLLCLTVTRRRVPLALPT